MTTTTVALVRAMLVIIVAGSGSAALAQVPPDRTGPGANDRPVVRPEYAVPATPEIPGARGVTPSAAGTFDTRDLTVLASDGSTAVARRTWMDDNAGQDLRLKIVQGQPLDPAWVREQFSLNGLIGEAVPAERIVGLVQLINTAFVRNGYINSGLLLEPGNDRRVTLKLVTGTAIARAGEDVGTVTWTAGRRRGLSRDYVRSRMPSLRDRPLNMERVERDFRLLAQDPAIKRVDARVQPAGEPGTAFVDLEVEPQPQFDLYATVSNSRSPSIGGTRAAVGGSVRNIIEAGDLLTAEAGMTSGRGDVLGQYEFPLGTSVTALARGGYNDAAVVDRPLRPLNIEARDWFVEGGVDLQAEESPLLPSATQANRWSAANSVRFGMRLAHRESRTSLLGMPFSFSPGSVNGRSAYTAARVTADWVRRGIRDVLAVSITATQGIDGTRTDIAGVNAPSRHFRFALTQISYARRLDSQGLELRARVLAQVSDSVLYSGERLSAGGQFSVRGYRENLLLADEGIIGSIELAKPIVLFGDGSLNSDYHPGAFTLSAFADGAALRNSKPPQVAPRSIASVGVKLLWTPSSVLSASISYAEALRNVKIAGDRDLQDRGISFFVTVHPMQLFRR